MPKKNSRRKPKSLAVYCGHQFGANPCFARDAAKIGRLMAERGVRLVFGAGDVGLMGTVAQAAVDGGGAVLGVSTHAVINSQEPMHKGIEAVIVPGINERKQRMYEESDGFCILPGGFGTLNELTDILTMQQVGESRKPIYFLDTDGYWDIFIQVFRHMNQAGFISPIADYNMQFFTDPGELVDTFIEDCA